MKKLIIKSKTAADLFGAPGGKENVETLGIMNKALGHKYIRRRPARQAKRRADRPGREPEPVRLGWAALWAPQPGTAVEKEIKEKREAAAPGGRGQRQAPQKPNGKKKMTLFIKHQTA